MAKKKILKGKPDGRPPAIPEPDLDKLKALMRLKPTLADTAAFFQCSERTVEATIRKHFDLTFFEFREQNMVHTRLSILRKAINMAESGNVPMLIFSLKNLCHWADKQEITGRDGAPISHSGQMTEEQIDARIQELLKKVKE